MLKILFLSFVFISVSRLQAQAAQTLLPDCWRNPAIAVGKYRVVINGDGLTTNQFTSLRVRANLITNRDYLKRTSVLVLSNANVYIIQVEGLNPYPYRIDLPTMANQQISQLLGHKNIRIECVPLYKIR